MNQNAYPMRGEVWLVNFDPTKGHEQSGTRPALVLSANRFNSSPASLVIVCPITSKNRNIRTHVELSAPEGGLTVTSYIMTEHLRSASKERLIRRIGIVSPNSLNVVEDLIRIVLDL